jgi:hypothetical protein
VSKTMKIALLLVSCLLWSCSASEHIDKKYEHNESVEDMALLGGYTVADRFMTQAQSSCFCRLFLIKTEVYEEMKRTGKGLLALGKKGKSVQVTAEIYDSVSIGDSFPVVIEREKKE